MGLITCPHCGKQVSDTVEACIHCGNKVTESPQKEKAEQPPARKGYETLTDYERRELEKEFVKGKPKYEKFFGKEPYYKYVGKISWAGYILGCAFEGVGFFLEDGAPALSVAFYVLGVIGIMISLVCDVSFRFILNKYRRQLLIVLKKYQKWLKEKSVDYVLSFDWLSARWQRYFDTINVDAEDI
ncbi:MAG: zinc ribbon domain-containing protein [Clostridia bacterium]|nr:zinc ribbon domain-containing protein [Clostridia bacterium]